MSNEICLHNWWDLDFIEDVKGLACVECGSYWDFDNDIEGENLKEGILTIWQSSKQAIAELQLGYQELAIVVGGKLNITLCDSCGKWFDKKNIHKVADHLSCENCFGRILNHLETSLLEDYYPEIEIWIDKLVENTRSIKGRWALEKQLMECEDLVSLVESENIADKIHLNTIESEILGLTDKEVSYDELFSKLASIYDLEETNNRKAKAWLVGAFSTAIELAGEEEEVDICEVINPEDKESLSKIALSLVIKNDLINEEKSLLSDSLLEAIAHRIMDDIKVKLAKE